MRIDHTLFFAALMFSLGLALLFPHRLTIIANNAVLIFWLWYCFEKYFIDKNDLKKWKDRAAEEHQARLNLERELYKAKRLINGDSEGER